VEQLIASLEAPIIRLVNFLMARAIERGASDIHLRALREGAARPLRIDGILETWSPPRRLQTAILSRIKIMAADEHRGEPLPQDGRVKLRIGGKEIDSASPRSPRCTGERGDPHPRPGFRAAEHGTLGFLPDTLSGFRPLSPRRTG